MKTPKTQQGLASWIRKEAAATTEWELGEGGRDQEMMLDYWKANRPKMLAQLKAQNLHKSLARVLEQKAMAQVASQHGTMPRTDSVEQAEKEWYLMEPETEDSQTEIA